MTNDILTNIWPEWQIEGSPLGRGSFGTVYKAVRKDDYMQSYSAIKAISIPTDPSEIDSLRSEGLSFDASRTYLQGIVTDFVNEIQLMTSLKGMQNIVGVEDYKVIEKTDELGWNIYIRMELLTPFNSYLLDHALSEADIIKLGCDICSALEVCQQRNIIHRDIKPENIFVNEFGCFKLGDFGIARKLENLTGSLSQKGTINYMAPEIVQGSLYDSRVDIYSLGIVLYKLMNRNRLPFIENDAQLMSPNERKIAVDRRLHGESLLPPCDASPAMSEVILRACSYNPNNRFASATEMKQALLQVSQNKYIPDQNDLSVTISVRKPIQTSNQNSPDSRTNSQKTIDRFGQDTNDTKKNSSVFGRALAIVLSLVILIGASIYFIPQIIDDSDTEEGTQSNEISKNNDSKTPHDTQHNGTVFQITKQPANVTTSSGSCAVTIVETSDDYLTYTWWVSDPGDTKFFKSSLNTNAYFVTMTPETNGRKAYCVISDSEGNTKTTETVTFTISDSDIHITQQPKNQHSSKGKTARTTIEADGNDLTYQWWVMDPGDTKYYPSSNKSNLYKVIMASENNGRTAFCIITDSDGNSIVSEVVSFTTD